MRCFVAIPLEPATLDALVRAGEAIRAADPAWGTEKWVRAENLHMTVAFLGEVDEGAVGELQDAISRRLAGTEAFSLPFDILHAAPNSRRASMLWARYRDPEGCAGALTRSVAAACEPFGVALQDRVLKPHVTLVRARRTRRVGERTLSLLGTTSADVPAFLSVPSATLLSSTLTKAGPVYRPLESWTFRAPDACS